MIITSDIDALREQLADWRTEGEHIALVPTMGNLHAGHMSLIELAREHAERVVVSVFVNPTQFAEGEDYEQYPRTLDRDTRRLRRASVSLVFTPSVETMYPFGADNATSVTVPALNDEFCGNFRPGHFDGVTTVVSRLFALVQPDVAVFGQKDYQQQLIIRRMVDDLRLPIRIVTGETVREDSGLAMSSRNSYLSDEEQERAALVHQSLTTIAESLQSGSREFAELESAAVETLDKAGFDVDYLSIRRAENLEDPDRDCDELVVLTAVRLGDTRLIDNIVVSV